MSMTYAGVYLQFKSGSDLGGEVEWKYAPKLLELLPDVLNL